MLYVGHSRAATVPKQLRGCDCCTKNRYRHCVTQGNLFLIVKNRYDNHDWSEVLM